jgi:hypothetical protein
MFVYELKDIQLTDLLVHGYKIRRTKLSCHKRLTILLDISLSFSIHRNIKSALASPGRSRVGPALYVFSLLGYISGRLVPGG